MQNSGASGRATSVDLGDLPFDMPKLRRRLRVGGVNLTLPSHISCNATATINNNKLNTDTSGVSQASSSQSVQQDDRAIIGEFPLYLLLAICNDDVGSFHYFFLSDSAKLKCC